MMKFSVLSLEMDPGPTLLSMDLPSNVVLPKEIPIPLVAEQLPSPLNNFGGYFQ